LESGSVASMRPLPLGDLPVRQGYDVPSTVRASIVIPAYNAGSTLGVQLDALIAERFSGAYEILVCDNGSTDDTVAVAEVRAVSAPMVRVVDATARRGPSAARNIGARAARGDVLLFCDADDVIETGWISAMVDALTTFDMVAGSLEGRQLNADNVASVSWEVSAEITMPFWPRYGAGASSNLGIRTDVFFAVEGFDESLRTGEDIDLCWRVQLAGFAFGRCPEAVVHSRQRDGLRAVFRQAFSYGAGTRALRVKYDRIIGAERAGPSPAAAATPVTHSSVVLEQSPPDADRALPTRLRRLLTRQGQANVMWRVGEWLGIRFGTVDPATTPLEPDRM
jgi:glycosyltransferase involved in cell wall biosynthesis